MKHVARGKYEMTFVPVCENASEHAPEDLIRKYYDLLEMEINETPHNWLWSHKRWK
jgi:KDO2-lipid IV(A) lauroyltransferase